MTAREFAAEIGVNAGTLTFNCNAHRLHGGPQLLAGVTKEVMQRKAV